MDEIIWNIMQGCWKAIPGERPEAQEVALILSLRFGTNLEPPNFSDQDMLFMLRLRFSLRATPEVNSKPPMIFSNFSINFFYLSTASFLGTTM